MPTSRIPSLAMTLAVVLLYTNLPVVAAQSGLVPGAAAAAIPALMVLAAVHQIVIRRLPVVVDRTLWFMLALLCVFLLSTVFVEGYPEAISRIGAFLSEGILIYFLVRNAVRTKRELRAVAGAIVLAAALLGALTTYQAVTGNFDQRFLGLAQRVDPEMNGVVSGLEDQDRARGPVDEPNRFAQILLMAAPLAFFLVLTARRMRGAVAAGLCLLLALAGVLLTYSRGAFLTLVILMLLAVPLGLLRARGLVGVMAAGLVVMFIAVPGYVARVASIAGVADLFGNTTVEADGPTRGRTTEMLAALAAYIEHPILGVGPGQYVAYHSVHYQSLPEVSIRDLAIPRRAHNLYLEMAAETGTIGLVVFLAIPLLLLRDLELVRRQLSRRSRAGARLAASFSLVVLSYLGTGVFLHLAFERYFWLMIGLTAAAVGILREQVARVTEAERLVPYEPDLSYAGYPRSLPC